MCVGTVRSTGLSGKQLNVMRKTTAGKAEIKKLVRSYKEKESAKLHSRVDKLIKEVRYLLHGTKPPRE